MSWHAHLQLHYHHDGTRTVAHDRHEGPLRVLQRLYPEGPAICHHVLVHPPAGSDVYLVARLWEWWPVLELERGQSYRLHISSMDWLHGFSLQPENINIQVHPGYEHVLQVQPTKAGTYSIICNEYCGINHHTMVSRLYVVAKK